MIPPPKNGRLVIHSNDLEEDRIRKGKGIMEEPEQRKKRLNAASDMVLDKDKLVPHDASREEAAEKRDPAKEVGDQNLELEDEEMTESELEDTIRELEKPIMDEEMVDKDDLLGEDLQNTPEQIDAISQLSTMADHNMNGDKASWPLPLSVIEQNKFEKDQGANGSRKKVQASPESKGLRASKKLQVLRSRASPNKKVGKGKAAGPPSRTKNVPQKEVFLLL